MSDAITITQLGLGETPALRRLFVAAVATDFDYFPTTYRRQVLRQNGLPQLAAASRRRRRRVLLGAYARQQLIGYAIGGINRDATAKVYWLYVDPQWRSHGVGGRLLHSLMDQFRYRGVARASLVTFKQADYYQHHGFRLVRTEPIYGVEMRVMEYRWPS